MATTELVTRAINTISEEEEATLPDQGEQPAADAGSELDNQAEDETQDDPEMPGLTSGDDDESEDKAEEEEETPVLRRSARQTAGVRAPDKLTLVTKISEGDWKEEASAEAIMAELRQLFTELKALQPVKIEEVPKGTKVLHSHMFVVEKLTAMGEHDKMKARIVADGRD
jgi:hypothetical protein